MAEFTHSARKCNREKRTRSGSKSDNDGESEKNEAASKSFEYHALTAFWIFIIASANFSISSFDPSMAFCRIQTASS